MNYEDYVREIAHALWEEEGRPDGEQMVDTFYGPIKLKERHWLTAMVIADIDFEIFQMFKTQSDILERSKGN